MQWPTAKALYIERSSFLYSHPAHGGSSLGNGRVLTVISWGGKKVTLQPSVASTKGTILCGERQAFAEIIL